MVQPCGREEVNVLALVKGDEQWVLLFDDEPGQIAQAMRTIRRWAANPEMSFTWYDAGVLCAKLRKIGEPEC